MPWLNNHNEQTHGRPTPSKQWMDMMQQSTNANTEHRCWMKQALNNTFAKQQHSVQHTKSWPMHLPGSALETTTTFPLKDLPQVSATEQQHQHSTHLTCATTGQTSWTTSWSSTTHQQQSKHTQEMMTRHQQTTCSLTPQQRRLRRQSNKPQHTTQASWLDFRRAPSRQPREQHGDCTETLDTPQTRNYKGSYRRRGQATPSWRQSTLCTVICATGTDHHHSHPRAISRAILISTAEFSQTPCGFNYPQGIPDQHQCLPSSTLPPSWWQPECSTVSKPVISFPLWKEHGWGTSDHHTPSRLMRLEDGVQKLFDLGALTMVSFSRYHQAKHIPDWVFWRGDTRCLEELLNYLCNNTSSNMMLNPEPPSRQPWSTWSHRSTTSPTSTATQQPSGHLDKTQSYQDTWWTQTWPLPSWHPVNRCRRSSSWSNMQQQQSYKQTTTWDFAEHFFDSTKHSSTPTRLDSRSSTGEMHQEEPDPR